MYIGGAAQSAHAMERKTKKPPSLHEPNAQQGRRHNIFRGTTLVYCTLTGTASMLRQKPLLTAGRCNGRTRCELSAPAPRPHGSETIFSFLFPALFHRPGFLVRINAKAYSSLHSHFSDIAFILIQPAGFVKTFNEVF